MKIGKFHFSMITEEKKEEKSLNFIEEIIDADLQSGKYTQIITRFPPNRMAICTLGMLPAFA